METSNYENQTTFLQPPDSVQGMKVLDRSAFDKEIYVPYIRLPVPQVNASLKKLKNVLLKVRKLSPVKNLTGGKQVFLDPQSVEEIHEIIKHNDLPELTWTKITLKYENYGYDAILKSILPSDLGDGISAFSIIGHIIHLNLKDHYKDYKNIIGEVLLDKFENITTVVNKNKTIEGTFRNFEMEVLAGEPNFQVTVKENGIQYEFDFSKVFWNPRLATEHANVADKLSEGDVVFDVFAGVGPFAIPAAKKKCVVHANDLNPDSYKWLCHNIKLNKVSDFVTAYNLDGHAFIKTVIKDKLSELYSCEDEHNVSNSSKNIHILMNLPASALEFVSSLMYLLENDLSDKDHPLPIVYVYFFVKSNDEDSQSVIKKHLTEEIQKSIIDITHVRNVAPNKQMYRATFTIPKNLLFKEKETEENDPAAKRLKLDVPNSDSIVKT